MSTTAVRLVTEIPRPSLSLASMRERIGVTLAEIAQTTRIAPDYLRAIEAEEFTKIPAGVYAASYIRQYARAIGYSEAALLDQYHSRTAAEHLPIVASPRGPRLTTRFGEAVGEALCVAMQLFHWRSPAKSRTHHPA